jgi:UDP-N-acetylglucosamine transferase subunit ALG13
MTDQERFIPTLEEIDRKIKQDIALTKSEKVFLSAVISNQINVQYGYADLITYNNDVEMYEFTKEITYQKEKAS